MTWTAALTTIVGYKSLSHGPVPDVLESASADEAIGLAVERIAAWVAEPDLPTVCVMVPTLRLRDEVARVLGEKGIESTTIEADSVDSAESSAVRVSTMHRAKGLEFDHVAVLMQPTAISEGDLSQLAYVSLTRAKTMALLVR